ncbi:MAG: hypothetical protein ACK5FG_00370 [Chryseotalea sp.]|jgi:hypothetical protein
MSEYTTAIEKNPEMEAFSLLDVFDFLVKVTSEENALHAIESNGWKTDELRKTIEARNVS